MSSAYFAAHAYIFEICSNAVWFEQYTFKSDIMVKKATFKAKNDYIYYG